MIAMAVACGPKLLIADEPTTALDVTTQAQVLDLLDDLRRKLSMAVLLITHDLGVVAQWADRINVMYAGRIVEQAGIGPFFARPCIARFARALGASTSMPTSYSANRLSDPGRSARRRAGGLPSRRVAPCRASCRATPPPCSPRGRAARGAR
jgi:peptide/nickel transport system ATP-binding protein